MKSPTTTLIFTAVFFATLLVTRGVQNTPASVGNGAGIRVSSSAATSTGQYQGPPQNNGTTQAESQRQYQGQGQRPLPNATVLAGAAIKPGISEPRLESALTGLSGGRVNVTAAAQQHGVTPQQRTEALGMPGGGQGGRVIVTVLGHHHPDDNI